MATEKRLIDANAYHLRLSHITMDELFPDWKELPRDTKDRVCKLAKEHERLLFEEPTVDTVKYGHWIFHKVTSWGLWEKSFYECSNCGSINPLFNFNYCPNCGADMRGETE